MIEDRPSQESSKTRWRMLNNDSEVLPYYVKFFSGQLIAVNTSTSNTTPARWRTNRQQSKCVRQPGALTSAADTASAGN
ncbi:hypothetical protein J6590_010281 [Homalodisca vitripennis]|nr:hypothetical protein J6590_010281 [Homalodisca vitripennis]